MMKKNTIHYRRFNVHGCVWLCMAFICLCSLSGCGTSEDISTDQLTSSEDGYYIEEPETVVDLSGWDNRFVDRLNLTQCDPNYLISGLQDVNATAEYDEVQLHIGQTMGDGQLLYIALDITLTKFDDVADDVLGEFSQGNLPISPGVLAFVSGDVQVGELTPQMIKEYSMMTSGSVQLCNIDQETKTFNFLIAVSSIDFDDFEKQWNYTDEKCSLLLGDVAIGEELVLDGPFVLTWTAENELPCWSQVLNDDTNEKIGTAVLTPLHMRLKWFDEDTVSEETTVEIDMGEETIVLLEELHTIGYWDIPLTHPISIDNADVFRVGVFEYDIVL